MKYIILSAGKGYEKLLDNKKIPKSLVKINEVSVIDNTLSNAQALNIKDIIIVGGFGILDIMESYPSLKYYYNEKWETSGVLYSLLKAISTIDDDILVTYGDVFHSNQTLKQLTQTVNRDKYISIAYDSQWKTRYTGINIDDIEKIYVGQDNNLIFSKNNINAILKGEFAGIFYIPKSKIQNIVNEAQKILEQNIQANILELFNSLIRKDFILDLYDIHGNWAELDSKQDIETFQFGTKAETLQILSKRLSKSKILEQVTFTVGDFEKEKYKILDLIRKDIVSDLLVVRSSALNEDTHNSSMAGNYESILKVNKNDDIELFNAIKKVIESYKKDNQEQNIENQILVQPYLENVQMSGVCFTKDLQTHSPYYIVNYENNGDTEAVTSGNCNDLKTFIFYRNADSAIDDKYLNNLIISIKEIESETCYDALDVEFAFSENLLYILQVRPIAAKKNHLHVYEDDIDMELKQLKNYVQNHNIVNHNLKGNTSAFGVMPDWNPAEIIGINPKPLAFDLYKYLITDDVWAKSRASLGYQDVSYQKGLISFSGKPYVDIKMSFNTFLPKDLDEYIASKLVDFWISKLKKEPYNHDKVEFEVALTSYDFNFQTKADELKNNGFSDMEINEITTSYRNLTNNILVRGINYIDTELVKAKTLENKRNKILNSTLSIPDKVVNLLEDCKVYGTLPFANLARLGFIGSILLKSLINQDIISSNEARDFFNSIHTVAKSFVEDFDKLSNNSIDKTKFLEKYGHLRPGTYDILSPSYAKNFDNYFASTNQKTQNRQESSYSQDFEFNQEVIDKIDIELSKHKLNIDAKSLINFIKKATEARELSKFEFTKNLSLVLDLIDNYLQNMSIKHEDIPYIRLNDIIKYSGCSSFSGIKNEIIESIKINRQKHLLTSAILLPELIFDTNDIDMFFYSNQKPNFISNHCLTSEIIVLNDSSIVDIDNKIVVIENADPGFDWIFSHNIRGLITKYGGAASHMAIRCAEFDLPAAIGCGDKIYNDVIKYKTIHLDCLNHSVKGIS